MVTVVIPRRFALVRHVDYTGVSGVGVVAFGMVFSDGHVVLRWCSSHPATSTWGSLEDMLAIHGHGEATSVQWIDAPAPELEEVPGASRVGRRARRRADRDADADAESSAGDPGIAAGREGPAAGTGAGRGLVTNGHARRRDPAVGTPGSTGGDTAADDGPDTMPNLDRSRVPGRHRRSDQVEPRR
ncbi:MAG TPA: hypothetical protein VFR13_12805 [Jiangellaceae bacterium]|nr:hypothetical protein [Jiangellaceae bacterium]